MNNITKVKAKRDDVIIFTKPGPDFGEKCVVRRVTGTYITASTSTNYILYLKHDEYTIENNIVKAKVGDTVVVTKWGLIHPGEKCIVKNVYRGSIMAERPNGIMLKLLHSSYEIAEDNPKTETASVSCPDCKDTGGY